MPSYPQGAQEEKNACGLHTPNSTLSRLALVRNQPTLLAERRNEGRDSALEMRYLRFKRVVITRFINRLSLVSHFAHEASGDSHR